MKQRILALALAVVLLAALLPTSALAAQSGTWGDNISWTFDNGLLTISGSGKIDPVYSDWDDDGNFIGTEAPWYNLGVTSVVVEQGVTVIGYGAFSYITTLKSVTLPDSVTLIDSSAFENCTGLETINLPSGLTTIETHAFENAGITSIEFPDSVTTIETNAFAGSALTYVKIPASVTYLSCWAFADCPDLAAIDVAEENERYFSVDGVLYGNLPYGGEAYTFLLRVPGGYSGKLTIPDGVDRFYDYDVMHGCTKVTEIYLPASIGNIASNRFYQCTSLTAIHVDEDHETLYDIDGVLYGQVSGYDENDESVEYLALLACPAAWSGATEYHVPEEVEQLASACFANCANLKNIYIGANTDSDCTAFQSCANLQGIWFDEDSKFFVSDDEGVVFNAETTQEVYDPEADTFVEKLVPAMTVLHFFPTGRTGYYEAPDGVTTIFDSAFTGAAIEAVKFPASLTRLSYWSMDLCDDLSWLLFTGDKPSHLDGCFEDVTATVYYPKSNDTWNGEDGPVFFASYGDLTYVPYADGEMPVWPGLKPVENPFSDVPAGSFYEAPVLWAVEKGITNGLSATTFGPNATCNRAQVVTFLWRAAGCPEPTSTVNPFVDVQSGSFYEKPVLWAVEKGITNGSDATHFGPNGVCNRAQVVTFLYRAFGSPAVSTSGLPFTDVPAGSWYEAPIAWAVANGVTNGLSATKFGPNASCNRAQVVTFLYRAYHN